MPDHGPHGLPAHPAPKRPAPEVQDVLIVDDHPLMCDALTLTLRMKLGCRTVRIARRLAEALEDIRAQGAPDAVILDLNLPDARGTEGVIALRRLMPDVPVTMISAETDDRMIAAALAAGVAGYVDKSIGRDALADALQRMWRGEQVVPEAYRAVPADAATTDARAELARRFATLTPQQMRILRLICQGKANKEVSYELSIAEATVKTHITAILSKINARRRTQAVLLANTARLFDRN